ncbi:MAG TPA: hypothetical protein VF692_03555 [Pyrinomonadaceae bacterium]|jgi:hypothetical protein
MKKITIISFFISLFSFAAAAQTKPKTVSKSVEAKTANTKTTSAKSVDKKPLSSKPKVAVKEKPAPEKSKSVKPQTGKAQTAKEQAAKTVNGKTSTPQTKTAKIQTTKSKFVKTESVKVQPVKSQPSPSKTAAQPNVKSPAKSDVESPVKDAPKQIVKPAIKQIANKPAKTIIETPSQITADSNSGAGEIVGKTYANKDFNFSVTLPDDWEIADADFAQRLKKEGFNLSLEMPKAASTNVQSKLNAAVSRVQILLTAYRASPETNQNAILRVSIEDLSSVPQVKDAVDYFDLMRATYRNIKLPAGFKYSETQAERLGAMQFGFLDVSSGAGKKRMYATVRGGRALMFTLTYNTDEDLAALKNVLAAGDFRRR